MQTADEYMVTLMETRHEKLSVGQVMTLLGILLSYNIAV